ncbi:MAG: hypothetical protein OXC71_03585 [Chloroflexi bacterium]|nr:hypothetical protein [Chloroflexota bacterium]
MTLRLVPWSPEYGSGIEADAGAVDDDGASLVDDAVEGAWRAIRPDAAPLPAVQIVDGVRRVEAHAIEDRDDGTIAFGLFGSYAVGVVRCAGTRAHILEDDNVLRVRRRYLQAGGDHAGVEARDRVVQAGGAALDFRAELPAGAQAPADLVAALNRLMLDEEARLAEELSEDASTLTIVDGPLRLRAPGPRVVGYVKRTHRWYLGAERLALLGDLAVGERTPLFRIAEDDMRRDRLAWFLRIADMGTQYHHLAGVVRLETPGALPPRDAAALADQTALVLPRLASSPIRDPRAPQNLTPVGALEQLLTRRLGDRLWLRRRIAAALAPASTPFAVAAEAS